MPIPFRRVVVSLICSVPALIAAQAQPPAAAAPHIPICAGLTLVTAVNDSGGDYESIKTIESVDDKQIALHYSTQKLDYGDMFDSHAPILKSFDFQRIVQRQDIRTSRAYLQELSPMLPDSVPGISPGPSRAARHQPSGKRCTAWPPRPGPKTRSNLPIGLAPRPRSSGPSR